MIADTVSGDTCPSVSESEFDGIRSDEIAASSSVSVGRKWKDQHIPGFTMSRRRNWRDEHTPGFT